MPVYADTTFSDGEQRKRRVNDMMVTPLYGGRARLAHALGFRGPYNTRPPQFYDDVNRGYSVGDVWATLTNFYTCLQNTNSNAIWQQSPLGLVLPQTAVGGAAPLFIGGTKRYNPTYTGNLIQVVRASDSTTLDIGQTAGWNLDARALETFGAGTTMTVSIIYNQDGSANHYRQTTAALRPAILKRNQTGDAYSIVFDSRRQGTTTNKYMQLDVAIAGTTVALSMFLVAKSANAISQSELMSVTGTSGARNEWFGYSAALNQFRSGVTGTGLTPLNGKPSVTPQVIGVISGGSAHTLWVDNTSATTSSLGSTAWSGGYLGYSPDDTANNGYFETPFVCVYGRALSATERTNLYNSLAYTLQLMPQVRDTFTCYGDSITESYGGSFLQSWGRQVFDVIAPNARHYEVGAFGQTAQALMVQSTMTTYLTPIANTLARNNVLCLFCGTNDYNGNITGAAVYQALITMTTQAKAMGFDKIIWCTTLPRTTLTATQEQERQNGNALIRGNYHVYAEALIDFANEATMGLTATASNTTYYLDGIHPTDLGYTYLAGQATPVFNSIILA